MRQMPCDLAVIGGGPAGLAAAVEAKRQGVDRVVVIERDIAPGGILRQCVHDGFGLHRFGQRMTGGQYAQAFIDQAVDCGVEFLTDTMVLEVTPDRRVYAVGKKTGMLELSCGAVILAMGCRERTRSQVFLYGTRPSGVMTAGAAQRYINIDGYLPGKRAVILGSGDIGLIMARRMTLEGMEVEGVYEVMPNLGGLRRNAVQCLEDYDIPLHLSTTVTWIHGEKRLEGVTVSQVDAQRKPISGTERYIPCDLLVLAVGLIPENELSKQAGIQLDPVTKGPVVDESCMTSVEGIFAAGNVAAVFDLVDYVSQTGEQAARGAAKYLAGRLDTTSPYLALRPGENTGVILPQRVRPTNLEGEALPVFLRVTTPIRNSALECTGTDGAVACRRRYPVALPPEMLCCEIPKEKITSALTISVKEAVVG